MRGLRRGMAGLGTVAAALVVCSSAAATTITVETTDASSSVDCSLTTAVIAANSNADQGTCPAGQGSVVDKINFVNGLTGTIDLGLGGLEQLTQDVEIDGPGASVLKVKGDVRPFTVIPGTTATISGITITGTCSDICGSQGGAILNAGELTLDSVAITGSSATSLNGADSTASGGAIFNQVDGALAVEDSSFSDNVAVASGGATTDDAGGGAIDNRGSATLTRSTFDANNAIATAGAGATSVTEGGAVSSSGDLTVTRSTFSTNGTINNQTGPGSATSRGGAISNTFGSPGSLVLEGSTIDDNSSDETAATSQGGGVFLSGSSVAIRSSTITGNRSTSGSQLQVEATAPRPISNTIVAAPTSGGATGPSCSGSPLASAGYNIEGTNSCGLAGAGDKTATDPMLQPLGNFGGPTETRPPMPGSPAIDAGKAAVFETTDQRGLSRPSDFLSVTNAAGGDGSDIGAVEIQDPTAAPDTVIDSGPADSSLSNAKVFLFTFHATEPGSTFECRVDGAPDWSTCSSPTSITDLPDGDHTFRVRATDTDQNTDQSPALRSFRTDTTAPKTTIGKLPAKTKKRTVKVTFKSPEAGATFECKLDGAPFKRCRSPLKLKNLKPGGHKIQVRATDVLGNTARSPVQKKFKVIRKKR